MKKITVCIACLLLMVLAVTPVLAAGSVQVTASADKTTAQRAEQITVTVAAEVDSCKSGGVELSYDSSVFELVSGEWLISGAFMSDFAVSTKDGVFAYTSATALSGDVFRFVLKVKDDATLESSSVTVKLTADGMSAEKKLSIAISCDHTYDSGKITKDPTCDKEGEKTFACAKCGATKKESVKATGHSYDAGKVTTEPTCDKEGEKTFTCSKCGATKTETVKKLDHTYDSGKVTTEPTCDKEGVKTFTCTKCGDTKTETIKTIDHTYDSGKVTKEPTCAKEGTKTFTCTKCGFTKTEAIKTIDHSYDDVYSSDDNGHWYACNVCGEKKDEEDHTFDNSCDTTCDACGYERETEHTYFDRWECDETGHWHACAECGEVLELHPHVPGPEATEETDQICEECYFVIQPAGNHVHGATGDWLSDEMGHWHVCACGEKMDLDDHIWDGGTVNEAEHATIYQCTVCGHTRSEALPDEPDPGETTGPAGDPQQPQETVPGGDDEDPEGGFPWWILLIIAGVLLLGGIIFVIIGILVSRKQVGKYSSK